MITFINTIEFVSLGLLSLFLLAILGMIVLERFIGPRKCDLCKESLEDRK